jgi:membrane-associated phospholipid phosphatase
MDELPVEHSYIVPAKNHAGFGRLSPRRMRMLRIDLACVLFFFIALLGLGITTHAPICDISKSRLTLGSAMIAALFLIIQLLFRHKLAASFFIDWVPLLGLFAVYENLKHMYANRITEWLGISPKDALMAHIDMRIFGSVLPLKFEHFSTDTLIWIMWFFYFWIYYCGPVLLLGWIYFRLQDQDLFAKLRHLLVIAFLGGYMIYILVPVAGPLFLVGNQFTIPIPTHPVTETLAFDYRYNWDCFPSLHTAIPWLLTIAVWQRMNLSARLICFISSFGIMASTIFLRLHYGIDLIAGLAWALIVYIFAGSDLSLLRLKNIFVRSSKTISHYATACSVAFRSYLSKVL